MNDAELAKLRKLASLALGKAINYLEQTESETLRAAREFEAKISHCERENALHIQLPRFLN